MLFNKYMSDLSILSPGRLALYVYGAAILVQHTRKNYAIYLMNQIITNVETWYRKWRLNINTSKTTALYVTREKATPPENKILVNSTEINWSKEHKYLAVTLDFTLSFEKHMANRIKTAKAALYPLLGKRSKLSSHNKMILFLAAIMYVCPLGAMRLTPDSKD